MKKKRKIAQAEIVPIRLMNQWIVNAKAQIQRMRFGISLFSLVLMPNKRKTLEKSSRDNERRKRKRMVPMYHQLI